MRKVDNKFFGTPAMSDMICNQMNGFELKSLDYRQAILLTKRQVRIVGSGCNHLIHHTMISPSWQLLPIFPIAPRGAD